MPVTGGEPTKFLPNASGLSWIGDGRVLYSEIMNGTSLHMGVVSSTESRAGEHEIWLPVAQRAWRITYASPDRKSALIVEMDRTATWQSRRLLPLDGSSGRQAGRPRGMCTLMLVSRREVDVSRIVRTISASTEEGPGSSNTHPFGSWHLWRSAALPDGVPEPDHFRADRRRRCRRGTGRPLVDYLRRHPAQRDLDS